MLENKMKGIMGLIEKDNKFLFGIESKKSKINGKWRLLGGKLEENETSEEAMIRECLEEANIQVKLEKFLGHVKIERDDMTIDLCHTHWISGNLKPKLNEIGKLGWFSLEEAKALDKDKVSELALSLFEETLPNKKLGILKI